MKNISLNMIIVSIVMIMLLGCSENILDENPPHLLSTDLLYSNFDGFDGGLNGLYAKCRLEYGALVGNENRAGMYLGGTDNLVSNSPTNRGFNHITLYWGDANSPFNYFYNDVFQLLYSSINGANTIIKQAENRIDVDWTGGGLPPEENKNRVIANAKAIRAWAYRHLTYGWGDVPLSLEESLGSNIRTDWERTPASEVKRQIIKDLIFAEQHIPVEPEMSGRMTKGAIQTYLAEMYLALNKPDSALIWADKVINTPEYKLITERYGVRKGQSGVPIADMYYEGNENRNQGNTEALWVWQFALNTIGGGENINLMRRYHSARYYSWKVGGIMPLMPTFERGGRGKSRQSITKYALDLYEPQDDRISNYMIRKFFILKDATENAPMPADGLPEGYNYGDTLWMDDWSEDISTSKSRVDNWPFSRKTDGVNPDKVSDDFRYNNVMYLRLAETYLLKAEAEFLLGRLPEAASTINIVRRRSNASDVSAGDISIDFILDERSRELIMEEHRRWTLLRTGKWLERVSLYNHNGGQLITARDTIFPIPQPVIDANLNSPMSQNPGF